MATQARNTSQFAGDSLVLPVKAGAKIYAGTMVAVDNTGHAVPAAKVADLLAAGRAEDTVDNLSGTDGEQCIKVARGVFKWDNDTANPVTTAQLLDTCYMADDCTVTSLATGSSAAGKVLGIDADGGIIVEIR